MLSNNIVKNFSWVFGAKLLVLFISMARAIILPKFLSVEGFGYWEIYWFYSCYAAIFCFGYNDGLYLKYGGFEYSDLPAIQIRSANRLLLGILSSISILGIAGLWFWGPKNNEFFSFIFVILNIPVVCFTGILIYIFQITNQFKKYSFFSAVDKILVIVVIIAMILVDKVHYQYIVLADFIGRFFVISLMIIRAKELLLGETLKIKQSFNFLWENISIGIKLMIANFMGMLLIGTGKIIVQLFGDIREFAIYSFGVSITGLILTAVTAISLVLYPSLKRISQERYPDLFCQVNSFTRLFGVIALLGYFPCVLFIEWFYPKYISIIPFLNIFFLVVYTNIKISVLTNTFFNVLRREKDMLRANLMCIGIFIIISIVAFNVDKRIWVIAFCTLVALLFRAYYSEMFLSVKLRIIDKQYLVSEIAYLIIFLFSTSFVSFIGALFIMTVAFVGWNIMNLDTNKQLWSKFYGLVK